MNIIEQLKANEKPFGLMSKEMQEKAVELDCENRFEVYCEGDLWDTVIATGPFIDTHVYRLRPDYEEKPEVVKCEVYTDAVSKLCYKGLPNGHSFWYCIANPDFIGFLYEDGEVCADARRYKSSIGDIFYSVNSTSVEHYEVLTPTHVLFRGAK